MTKEEFNQKIQEITSNLEDQGKVTAALTELSQEYEKVITNNDNLTTLNDEFKTKNQELKDYNMKLFMQVTTDNKTNEKGNSSLDAPDDKEEPKLKYEDLFDEKGDFK